MCYEITGREIIMFILKFNLENAYISNSVGDNDSVIFEIRREDGHLYEATLCRNGDYRIIVYTTDIELIESGNIFEEYI